MLVHVQIRAALEIIVQRSCRHISQLSVVYPRKAACRMLLCRRQSEDLRRRIHRSFQKLAHMPCDTEHVPHGCSTLTSVS